MLVYGLILAGRWWRWRGGDAISVVVFLAERVIVSSYACISLRWHGGGSDGGGGGIRT